MTRMSQVQGHVTNLATQRGNVPLLRLGLGLLLLAFFLLALMLQVQTSEAFILQGNVVSFGANWGIKEHDKKLGRHDMRKRKEQGSQSVQAVAPIQLLTIPEVARRLSAGLPAVTVGSSMRIAEPSLQRWIQEHERVS